MIDPTPIEIAPLQLTDGSTRANEGCNYCITIPAKNEAGYIVRALEALYYQLDLREKFIDRAAYEVILLANNCTDNTAGLAREFGALHPEFQLHVVEIEVPREIAGIGVARRLLSETALSRLPDDGIIITTDADSYVDRHWLYYTAQAFSKGARAVGGRIIVDHSGRGSYRKTHLQDVTYRMLQARLETIIDPSMENPWPRHFQNYGPSTALSVAAYRACGGMPAVKCIEDVHLAWALERIDIPVVQDPRVKVYTSDRESERIEGVAFSRTLDEWTRMQREGRQAVVWGLGNCIQLYKWKVALRRAFNDRRIGHSPALNTLLETLHMSGHELERRITEAVSAGALYQDLRRMIEATHGYSDVTFERAISDLRQFTRSARLRFPYAPTRPGDNAPHARYEDGESR